MSKEALSKLSPKERELLEKLVREGLLEIKPTIGPGGVRYPEAEEALGEEDPEKVRSLLEGLASKGVLESSVVDRVLLCPDCGSPEVYSKYACPKCNSINVDYSELLEHVKCGYIAPREAFSKGEDLVCPNCKTELSGEGKGASKDGRYTVIGASYRCEKCGYNFDAPEIVHVCQKCHRTFTYRDAKYAKVYAYKIPDFVLEEIGMALPLKEALRAILREKGYNVKIDGKIRGASGAQHTFDVVAEKDGKRLVVDVSKTGTQRDIVSLLGKKMDTNPTAAILIDSSGREEVRSLSKVYGITVIEGRGEEEVRKDLLKTLAKIEGKAKGRGEK